jgi:hypothetical protein
MTQADRVLSTPPTNTPVDTTRRHFLLAVGGGTVAMLAATVPEAAATAPVSPLDPVFNRSDSAAGRLDTEPRSMGGDAPGAERRNCARREGTQRRNRTIPTSRRA